MTHVASLDPSQAHALLTDSGALQVRRIPRSSCEEVFLTATSPPQASPRDERLLCARVAQAMASLGLEPLQETIYGRLDARARLEGARSDAWLAEGLDPSLPHAYLEGIPVHAGDLAGIQVWGVVPAAGSATRVTTVGRPGESLARCWSGPDYRLLQFPVGQRSEPQAGVTEQASAMLADAEVALAAHGLTWLDVPRTWIYVARILDWYGELNHVRTAFFRERGVGRGPGRAFPASTGIQARTGAAECALGFLAVEGAGVRVTPVHQSARQRPAFDYGSAFSRATALELEGRETLFVSGTASIDSAGATLHLGEVEAQVLETLLSIAALLETRGAGLEDLCQATLFCKTPAVLRAFEQVTRLLRLPAFPCVPVIADVCRPELLVEIEAVARVPGRRAS